jgi:hypothetical protein
MRWVCLIALALFFWLRLDPEQNQRLNTQARRPLPVVILDGR